MQDESANLTRRQSLAALGTAAAAAGLPGCDAGAPEPKAQGAETHATGARLPTLYIPHGGGPWPFVDTPFGARHELDALTAHFQSIATAGGSRPRAIVVVSAHWEAPVPTVMTAENPPLYFDYYNFPKAAYELTWPAPGSPGVAARVRELLAAAGIPSAEDPARGFDHGTFVPLKLAFPEADVPTVQLSLKTGLDPAEHLAIGRALAPLRDESVLIVGSGMSYHNMRGMSPSFRDVSETFDAWLRKTTTGEPAARDAGLTAWAAAPSARLARPREEHLLPLMVVAGAAGSDRGRTTYDGTLLGLRLSSFAFAKV